MEEGKGERYLASGRQYGNALLGIRHQEEDIYIYIYLLYTSLLAMEIEHTEDYETAYILGGICSDHRDIASVAINHPQCVFM